MDLLEILKVFFKRNIFFIVFILLSLFFFLYSYIRHKEYFNEREILTFSVVSSLICCIAFSFLFYYTTNINKIDNNFSNDNFKQNPFLASIVYGEDYLFVKTKSKFLKDIDSTEIILLNEINNSDLSIESKIKLRKRLKDDSIQIQLEQEKLKMEIEKLKHENQAERFSFFVKCGLSLIILIYAFYLNNKKDLPKKEKRFSYYLISVIIGVWIGGNL